MPKDKTATHNKIMEVMKREFLEKGYEKAALNIIAKEVGITAAGIYRHFSGKEEMFAALVNPAISEFEDFAKTLCLIWKLRNTIRFRKEKY